MKDTVEEIGNYQEILNTVVGSKVYYAFQEAISKEVEGRGVSQEEINKYALKETIDVLWFESDDYDYEVLRPYERDIWASVWASVVEAQLTDKGIGIIFADTFERFLEQLRELKYT